MGQRASLTRRAWRFRNWKPRPTTCSLKPMEQRMLPLKAHAEHEPMIPECAKRTVCVVGIDGVGSPISQACHRAERFAQLADASTADAVTPEMVARVLEAEGLHDMVLINKVESDNDRRAAERIAAFCDNPRGCGKPLEERISMLAMIRGAGDIASAIALRLHKCGASVIMTEVEHPLTVRRAVAFSEAIHSGKTQVEGVVGVRAESVDDALRRALEGVVPVLVDPKCSCIWLEPDVLVDAILAKRNVGTTIGMAPIVIGIGPGFTAGNDCHAVVETMRGHTLGRVYYEGSALPNTAVPGLVGGFAGERVLRAPSDGTFREVAFNSRPRRGGTGRRIRGRRPCDCHPHRHATRPACWRNACSPRA